MRQLLAHCASPAWLLRASARQVFFVVGKNYRLQDIQLSKNASYFEAPGCQHSAAIPPEHRLRGEPLSNLCEVSGTLPLDQPSKLTAGIRFVQAYPDCFFSAPPPPEGLLAGLPSRNPPPPRSGSDVAKAGGECRARTGDLLVANQALSQLS